MSLRSAIESLFCRQVEDLVAFPGFRALEAGQAPIEAYDRFVANVVRTHLKSPQIVAFLLALAPPESAAALAHNMLEEMGVEDESGVAHPSLLEDLAAGAGIGPRLPELRAQAEADLRQVVVDPLLYGTLREVGLGALCEVVSFEFMLSRTAGRMARALATHRGLSRDCLRWFVLHSEVDIGHAEQGLDNLEAYARYYEFSPEDATTILEATLRENVYVRRYFREAA
jgi:hypothetical protein